MNSNDFNTYEEFIDFVKSNNDLSLRKKLKTSDPNYISYHDHHIVPISLGGVDDKSNMIRLTCLEHLIAHILLCKKYSDDKDALFRMTCALHRLITGEVKSVALEKIDEAKVAKILEKRAKLNGDFFRGKKKTKYTSPYSKCKTEEERQIVFEQYSKHKKGQKRTEEQKARRSAYEKSNPNNPMIKAAKEGINFFKGHHHTEELKAKLSARFKGHSIYEGLSEEEKQARFNKRSASQKGENNPCFGTKVYYEVATGKMVKRKEHPGDGFVTSKEWREMKK